MKMLEIILLLSLIMILLVNVIADTFTQFNNNDISENMSFVNVNSTVRYINLTTAKVKNANITIAGFVNLTQNTTFTKDSYTARIAWNGSHFIRAKLIETNSEYEFASTLNINDDVFNVFYDIWNFSFIDFNLNEVDDMDYAFNNSELYFLNRTNRNDVILHRTNFPNKPINTILNWSLPNNVYGITFKDNQLWSCEDSGDDDGTLIRRHNNNNFSIIVENFTASFPTRCNTITYDGTTMWLSGRVPSNNSIPTRMNENNYSIEDYRHNLQGDNAILYDGTHLYSYYQSAGVSITKYYKRGFPFNLYINVGNDSTIEYVNTTENKKNITTVYLDASGFNTYISSNCAESRTITNCTVPIIFNATSANWAYSNIQIAQNNVSNATNVSITPLPIVVGNNLKGHANYSDPDNDIVGGNQTYWYVNKSIINEANNSFILLGGNVTELANITFSARFNDTYDWSNWVNSSVATVGDSTAPTITTQAINGNSFTTEQRVNVTTNCTDAVGVIDYVRVEWNRTGSYANDTMTLLNTNQYSYSALFAVGSYNTTNIYCSDGNGNIARDLSNFTFTVTSPPSGGGGAGGGGGGGGQTKPPIIILGNLSLVLKPPIIASNFLYTPFKKKMQRFSIELVSNKEIEKCISEVFECTISNNIITVALNYSNDSVFISKVESKVTLIDKTNLANTIDASVRFINLAVAVPFAPDVQSTKYLIFRLSNGDNGLIKGIRVWFLALVLGFVASALYLLYKEGYIT